MLSFLQGSMEFPSLFKFGCGPQLAQPVVSKILILLSHRLLTKSFQSIVISETNRVMLQWRMMLLLFGRQMDKNEKLQ